MSSIVQKTVLQNRASSSASSVSSFEMTLVSAVLVAPAAMTSWKSSLSKQNYENGEQMNLLRLTKEHRRTMAERVLASDQDMTFQH